MTNGITVNEELLSELTSRYAREYNDLPNTHKQAIQYAYLCGKTDAINECKEAFNEHLFDSPMMNPIMTRNEILLFLDHLKEQLKKSDIT